MVAPFGLALVIYQLTPAQRTTAQPNTHHNLPQSTMGFFSRNQPEAKKEDSISTAAWQSIASGNSSNLDDNNRNDGNGFVNPEGPMALAPSSAWEKERYSQQMELEDGYRRKKRGRCSACIGWIIKVLHGVDVCLGISLIVYGSLIRTQFEPPAMAAAIFCLLLGTILFVSSAVGIFSYASRSCSRWGLLVSGFVAPYLSVVYITIIISLVVDSSGFFQYLEDHHDVMYFSENVVQNLEGLMGLVYSILGTLTALELTR